MRREPRTLAPVAKREPRDTRQRILSAGLEVFAEVGYARASVEEIAARAGMTKGAVYYWFADKDDLARDLQRDLWTHLASEVERVTDPELDTIESLRRGFGVMVSTLQRQQAARFFLRDVWLVPSLDEAGRNDQEAAVHRLRAVLERGIDRGDVIPVDADALARVTIGAFVEATLHILTGTDAGATIAVIDTFLGAFAARPASLPVP